MYGKIFSRAFQRSMRGSGSHVFSVMAYVIANTVHSRIELDAEYLAIVIGDTKERMQEAIDFLCAPDPKSTHDDFEGRRLVKEGKYQYYVPTHELYRGITTPEELREANRNRVAKHRENKRRQEPGTVAGETVEDPDKDNVISPQPINGRLYGIPSTVEDVIAYGSVLVPPIPEEQCRSFWAHYEGQARKDPDGNVFWITSGEAVVTNWRVKLSAFRRKFNQNNSPKPKAIAV